VPREPVHDATDPRLEAYRELRDAELRRRRNLFAVEGRRLVERLLTASRFRARSVLATPAMTAALAPALGDVPTWVADEDVIRGVVGFPFHRGAIALGERGDAVPLDALLSARTLVVLEALADPENVGGIMRCARALGADGVVLAPGVADPLGRKAIRVSAGAALTLPFSGAERWPDDLARLRAAGFALLALTPDRRARDVRTETGYGRVALLVGAEGDGLSPGARDRADVEIRIPMATGVDSLNVVVAAGIALHHLGRTPP
jgi:tRNA G18 (ribose-2'-O)-methylase SpoU